jgi:hypothetical protein
MKQCPSCNRKYSDSLSYCLNDGTLLLASVRDSEATVFEAPPRTSELPGPTIPFSQKVDTSQLTRPASHISVPAWAVALFILLGGLVVVAAVSLILATRGGGNTNGQVVSTSPVSRPSPSLQPTPTPTPTIDQVAANKPAIISAIRLSTYTESEADRTLDTSGLTKSYQGEALKAETESVKKLKAANVYLVDKLEDQKFGTFNVSADGKSVNVHVIETWSGTYYSSTTGQCVSKIPSHKAPQTYYLKLGDNGWMVDNVVYDKTTESQPVAC